MIIFDKVVTWPDMGQEFLNEDGWKSQCRIRIVKLNKTGAVSFIKNYYIVASDLGAGSGTSISYGAQTLIPHVCTAHNIAMEEMVWFEHYPHDNCDKDPTLDVVTPKPVQSCCPSACFQGISVESRPARSNEVTHLKQFVPDLLI